MGGMGNGTPLPVLLHGGRGMGKRVRLPMPPISFAGVLPLQIHLQSFAGRYGDGLGIERLALMIDWAIGGDGVLARRDAEEFEGAIWFGAHRAAPFANWIAFGIH